MADEAGNATEFLTKKAGPLPVGVWIALVAGGLGITWYLNRGKNSNAVASTGTTGNGVTDATGSGTYNPVGASAGGSGSGSGSGNAGTGSFADNNAWGRASVDYLISLGFDPGVVNQAIGGYLSSQPLTTQQQSMVNSALQHFGSPPLIPAPVVGGGNTDPGTGGSTGTLDAPGNLHVNKYPGGNAQIVWNADADADSYDVTITSDLGSKLQTSINGPHAGIPTGMLFPMQPVHSYTAEVTPRNKSGAGPSGTVGFSYN